MMSGYYPEFYLRKRQREQAYRRATVVIVGFLLLIVVGGIAGFFIYKNVFATRRTQPGASPELAEQRQKLETQQRIADARLPDSAGESAGEEKQPAVDLKSVPYSESFPQVQVGLEGITPSGSGPAGTDQAVASAGDESEAVDAGATQPEGSPNTGEAPAPPAAGIGAPGNPAASQPTPQDSAVARVKTDDQAAADKKASDKLAADAKRLADKRKLDDQKKRDLQKKEQAKLDAKAAAKGEAKPEVRPEPKPVAESAKPAGEPKYVYTVYASTYLSQDDAEKAKGSLGAIGLSGSVINAHTGDYLLMVGSLNDIDSANALKARLASSGFGGAFVTRKVKK